MMLRGRLGPGALAGLWGLLLLLNLGCAVLASEITFELPDNAKQCFYEEIMQGVKCTLEFQVSTYVEMVLQNHALLAGNH